jgi:hypothetical protein
MKTIEEQRAAARVRRARYRRKHIRRLRAEESIRSLAYYYENKDQIREKRRMAYKGKAAVLREKQSQWYKANRPKIKRYYKRLRPSLNNKYRARYASDLNFRLAVVLRARIRRAIYSGKAGSAIKDLGCSLVQLRCHIEGRFLPGMTWQNWGSGPGKWHLDHIRPLASFDLSQVREFKLACHFSNLQPLWSHQNQQKHCKTVWP